jgi:hypothetical protein
MGLACGIAGVSLTSALVDPSDYGAYGVFASLAVIGVGVVYTGVIKFVSRHWIDTKDQATLLQEVLGATARRTPWLLLAAVGAAALATGSSSSFVYGALLFLSALLLTVMQLAQTALQANREHWRDFGVTTGVSVTRSFLPPILYASTGLGLTALLTGFMLHALVGAALGAWSLRRFWRDRPERPTWPVLSGIYDGPRFVAIAAASWTLLGLNRWLVAWRFSAETAGYFNLAVNIGSIIPAIMGSILLLYFQPQWFSANPVTAAGRRKLLAAVDRVALTYTMLAVVAALGLHGCMPWLVGSVVNGRYAAATSFVFVAGCWSAATVVGSFFHAMLLAARREQACTAADLSGTACLMFGAVFSACAGLDWFRYWLLLSPLVPWVVNRSLARQALQSET